jgi:hypothetical protein
LTLEQGVLYGPITCGTVVKIEPVFLGDITSFADLSRRFVINGLAWQCSDNAMPNKTIPIQTNTTAYPVQRAIKTTSFAALKEAASYELKVFFSTCFLRHPCHVGGRIALALFTPTTSHDTYYNGYLSRRLGGIGRFWL